MLWKTGCNKEYAGKKRQIAELWKTFSSFLFHAKQVMVYIYGLTSIITKGKTTQNGMFNFFKNITILNVPGSTESNKINTHVLSTQIQPMWLSGNPLCILPQSDSSSPMRDKTICTLVCVLSLYFKIFLPHKYRLINNIECHFAYLIIEMAS